MNSSDLLICEKRRLLARVNEEIEAAETQRQRLIASLSFDEAAVYRVATVKALYDRHGGHDPAAAKSSHPIDPALEVRHQRVMQTLREAVVRFEELRDNGRIPAIEQRLEKLGLLPVWLP